MKIYVCSPLRGADGQPSSVNIALARRLMKAVFDAGEAPFVPHLLYPQVLSESPKDLAAAFDANFAFLTSCNEIWVWARRIEECSSGMRMEVEGRAPPRELHWRPKVLWMPGPFVAVEAEGWRAESKGSPGRIPGGVNPYVNKVTAVGPQFVRESTWNVQGPSASCVRCHTFAELNREGWCRKCFAGGTAA